MTDAMAVKKKGVAKTAPDARLECEGHLGKNWEGHLGAESWAAGVFQGLLT